MTRCGIYYVCGTSTKNTCVSLPEKRVKCQKCHVYLLLCVKCVYTQKNMIMKTFFAKISRKASQLKTRKVYKYHGVLRDFLFI